MQHKYMGEIDWKIRMYHALPSGMKNLVATWRGRQLESLRCGPRFEGRVADALGRETWDKSSLESYQKNQLERMLVHARESVPFYKKYWDNRSPAVSRDEITDLNSWPILEKESVRSDPHSLLAHTSDRKKLKVWHTSGSTGTPTKIFWSKEFQQKRWAVFEARHRRWYGVTNGDPFALIGGRMVTPFNRDKPPFWVWNGASKQLYLSAYHLSEKNIPFYIAEMKRRKVRHIYAYTSGVYEIANYMIVNGLRYQGLKVIVTQAEPLLSYQREVIHTAFDCPVRESYGMSEMVALANECEHGKMHLSPEYGICEVEDSAGRLSKSGEGDLIVTGFLNDDMPLIRYRVGDRVSLADNLEKCSCGRSLPILHKVEGRTDDVLITEEGRRIGRLSTVFKNLPIVEVQTIQESFSKVKLIVVPDRNFDSESEASLVKSFRERMGDIEVVVNLVHEIPRGANGKFRSVICNVKS